MKIPLNTVIECLDGLCGRSTRILVSAKTHQVTHFVVKLNQPPFSEVVVPERLILEILHNLIRVRCTQSELKLLDPFIETNYIQVKVQGLKGLAHIKNTSSA